MIYIIKNFIEYNIVCLRIWFILINVKQNNIPNLKRIRKKLNDNFRMRNFLCHLYDSGLLVKIAP